VVAWSWDLLGDDERRLADLVAAFPAGVTAESTAGVARLAGFPLALVDAADLLAALVDRSLLQIVDGAAESTRYRMLETIREYGLERLAGDGSADAVRAAHARYFLALAEQAEPYLRGHDQIRWLRLVNSERDNLAGAVHFASEAGDAETAIRLGSALSLPWAMLGYHAQAAALLDQAMRVPGPAPADRRAIVTAMFHVHTAFAGNMQVPPELVDVADVLAGIDPAASHPFLPLIPPVLALITDDTEAGLAAVEEGLKHPDPWARAMLRSLGGMIRENSGDADGMLRDLTAAADGLREVGDRWGLSATLAGLADAHSKRGNFAAAIAAIEEAIRLLRELNPLDEVGYQQVWLGVLRARTEPERGRAELERYIAEHPGPEAGRQTSFALMALADLDRMEGDLDRARELLTEAWRRQGEAPLVAPQFRALLRVADAYVGIAAGELVAAAELLADATEHARFAQDMPVLASVAVGTAGWYAAAGDPDRAAEALGVAENQRGTADRTNRDAERLERELRATLGEDGFAAARDRGIRRDRGEAASFVDIDPSAVERSTVESQARRR
jgi:tetratricopeptide (TPR) repeat protein